MKVMRKIEVLANREHGGFKVGDQIHVGKHYAATCQKVKKNGAIFMFDQYLDEVQAMNLQGSSEDGYEASDLRKFLKKFVTGRMFDEIRDMMVSFKKTGDLLRIPMAEEMFGPKEAHKCYEILSHEKQWTLMKNRHNRIAFHGEDQGSEWGWLQNRSKNLEDPHFAVTNSLGNGNEYNASGTIGVRVVFQLSV